MVCPGLRLRFVAPTRQIVQSPTAMPRSTAHDTIAYRLTEILLRLNAGQALDPQQLADEFNVHPRTIRRDLNERFGFIGLEKKDDRYTLPRTRLGTFSLQDVQRFASLAGLQGMAPRLSTEFLKDILDNSAQSALLVRGQSHENISDKEHELAQLKQAIEGQKMVSFGYSKPDGARKTVTVAPYKLVLQDGVWYLQASDAGQIKSYAVTRMDELQVQSDTFTPDAATADYLGREDSIWLNVEKTEVLLKIASPAAGYFQRRQLIGSQKIEKLLADGSLIVSGQIAHPNQILPVVRYWMPCIRIISPEGLQADLNLQLKAYLEMA